MRVLIIEDDSATAMSMELMLKAEGFNCYTTDLGEEGADLAAIYDYDLITLDLGLPDISGLEVLRRIRVAKNPTPVMVISGRSDVEMKVKTFGGGADDYLQKPFHKDEFVARAHALIRRSKGHASAKIEIGPIVLDLDGKTVDVAGHRIHLTGKEYQMLELLMLRKGSTLTKENFLNHLYGGMDEPELKIIDVFICKLRKKLSDASGVNHIETVWGRGYRIVDAPVTKAPAMESAVRDFVPKDHLNTVRGRLLRVLAEHDQPLMAGTISIKLGHEANPYESGVYSSLSQATRVGLVEAFGKRGGKQYGLSGAGREWLARAGWKPEAAAA